MGTFRLLLEFVVMHARDAAFTFFLTLVIGFFWGVKGLIDERRDERP